MKEFIDKLIGRLEELKELHAELIKDGLEEDFHSGCEGMCVDIIEIVNELAEEYKVSEMPTGWIPCSERLPEVEADVLLSLRSLDVYTGFRANTEGCFYVEGEGYVVFENVLAWMPLPAPYTEGE